MTTDHVHIGGVERPFHFSNKAAYQYELNTGRRYTSDLMRLFEEIGRVVSATQSSEGAAAQVTISLWADFAYAGFAYAHRKAGRTLDFDVDDLAGWMLDDDRATNVICEIIIRSVTNLDAEAVNNEAGAKKKTVRPRAAA